MVWTTDLPPDLTPTEQPVMYFDTATHLGNVKAPELGQALRTLFTHGTPVEVFKPQVRYLVRPIR